jgi:ParB-like chromosome segregation protein Spo0J
MKKAPSSAQTALGASGSKHLIKEISNMKTISHTKNSGKSPAKVAQANAAPPATVARLTDRETPSVPATTPKAEEVAPLASIPTPPVAALPVVAELPIASIRLDGGTQSRASLSTTTITEYSEAMSTGAKFPPIVVFYDGKTRWLADGFHRVSASMKNGQSRIACEVRQGSQRDAILFSVTANATHGLRRSNADKKHAVELLLADAKWSKKSDRWIADTCGVSHPFVSKAREQLVTVTSSTTREGKDGKARNLPKAKAASPKGKPASPTDAPAVASRLSIAMAAPVDEASALADLQSDIERHLLAWTWSIDPVLAVLASTAEKVRNQFATREAI